MNKDWKYICDPIVDEETWNAVQTKLKNSFRTLKPTKQNHEFNSLLRCGICGRTLAAGYINNKRPTYSCLGRKSQFHLDGSPKCTLPVIKDAKAFDKQLSRQIIEVFSNPVLLKNHLQNTFNNLEAEFKALQQELYPLTAREEIIQRELEKLDAKLDVGRIKPDKYREQVNIFKKELADIKSRKNKVDTLKLLERNRKEELLGHFKVITGEWDINSRLERLSERGKMIVRDHILEGVQSELIKPPRELMTKYGFVGIVHEDGSVTLEGNIPTEKSLNSLAIHVK
ncbi:MAG: hypothetical protein JSU58_01085 [Dehalococcoidales bacterium]|nr:MAG: hypothetical protein JSU58_01085 [Dehalococcoidales bacterium]